MSVDFDAVRRELTGLRKRATDIQDGATKGVELAESARFMVYAVDRLKMLTGDIEREFQRVQSLARDANH
jgi:hypothetical protein